MVRFLVIANSPVVKVMMSGPLPGILKSSFRVVDVRDRLPQRTRAGIARIDYRDCTSHRRPAQGAATQEGTADD
jgi:hypothetical protein